METRRLDVKLTTEDLAVRRTEHLAICQKLADLEEEKKAIPKRIEQAKDSEAHLRKVIKSGKEERDVEVARVARGSQWALIRVDTNDVVELIPMTHAERQMEIDHSPRMDLV